MIFPKSHAQTYRFVPETSKPLNDSKLDSLLKEEWSKFTTDTGISEKESLLASKVTPLGVASSFQHWTPYPISIASANGAWMTDVDGRKLLDLSMGFGAILAGHLNPVVVQEIKDSLSDGMLFVTPSPITRDASERLCTRFGLDMVRFTNSGTESTMYATRLARVYSGKNAIVKLEGGYHGSFDPLMVSAKPSLDKAGDPNSPNAVSQPGTTPGEVYVVPFNNLEALEKVFTQHHTDIACFILEPVLENIAIVLPDEGYLEGVRALCDKFKIVLIFDEVKTGLTAGPQGAAQRLGIKPDLITIAKSIGGGVPVAAFGGKKEIMDAITTGQMTHFGTFNGNPLAMAGVRAMDKLSTKETLKSAEDFNLKALNKINEIIGEFELPAHTVGFGVKGCVTWSTTPVRNYRDYKSTDFKVSELSWLWSMNRGIITPPGLDEQWLISFAHGQDEIDVLTEDFHQMALALRS